MSAISAALTLESMIDFLLQEVTEELAEEAIEYGVLFGGTFVLLWLVFSKALKHRKIQEKRRAGPKQWVQEVLWSMIAELGALILGFSLLWTEQIDPLIDVSGSSWVISALGLLAVLVVVDAWFYWLHRSLHDNRFLYRHVHRIHHGSVDVTPLASNRFHPLELFLITLPNAIIPAILFMSPWAYVAAFAISLLNNVYGHCGYELLPTAWSRIPVLKHKTTSLHHNMHHERSQGNFALYFTWWDRLMGTEFSDFAERQEALNQRIRRTATVVDSQPLASSGSARS